MDRILTVPEEIPVAPVYLLTGNEYVSIPAIRPTGAIEEIGVVSQAARGLLSWVGEPLLRPVFRVLVQGRSSGGLSSQTSQAGLAGQTAAFRAVYRHHWLPEFTSQHDGVLCQGLVFAPPNSKGFVYLLAATNRSSQTLQVQVGMEGAWSYSRRNIYTGHRLICQNRMRYSQWAQGIVLEMDTGLPLAALALAASEPLETLSWGLDEAGADQTTETAGELMAVNDGDHPVRFTVSRQFTLRPGEGHSLAVYLAVNQEGDGAAAVAVHLKRRGWGALLRETTDWLDAHTAALARAPELEPVLNRNLFFNYFYTTGNALDTDEMILVTSRSPRYYVSAAFWARDALLWSFPALMLIDTDRARQVLITVATRHLHHAGIHSHYLDGTVLYPGFELDQLCTYPLAVERYLRETGDASVLAEPVVAAGLSRTESLLWEHRHTSGLFDTFLSPSDDPCEYPYVTYDNVLAWRALLFLADWHRQSGRDAAADRLQRTARVTAQAIRQSCATEGPFGPMFSWSTDLQGSHLLADEPPGSLQLLSHYGFCQPDDPVFQNTLRWIRSPHNPHFRAGAPFSEPGCAHTEHPWPMSAASGLLCGRQEEGRDFFGRAQMDNGLACESVDEQTGLVKTGAAFAACAGWLAYCLHAAFAEE